MLCSSPFLITPVHAELVPPARSGQSLTKGSKYKESCEQAVWWSVGGRGIIPPTLVAGTEISCGEACHSVSFLLFWCSSESSWHMAAGQGTDAQVLKTQSLPQLGAKWNAGWDKKSNTRGVKPPSICAIVCHSCGSPGQECLFLCVYAVPSAGTAMSLRAVWESKNQPDRCPLMTYIFYLLTITATKLSIITQYCHPLWTITCCETVLSCIFLFGLASFGFLHRSLADSPSQAEAQLFP